MAGILLPSLLKFRMADDVPLALYLPAGLFLKPDPKISIEVKLPDMKQIGVSVSNWEVMEKMKVLVLPEVFVSLRVINYTREVIHFEGEFESTRVMRKVILLIDGKSIKLSGFPDLLKVRAKLKDVPHPTKQQWEDYFSERGMESFDDERPGERPDTIVVKDLPVKWFASRTSEGQPCPRILTQAFQKFGRVREVGIYQSTPAERKKSFSSFGPGMKGLHFEAYIQYEKYSALCNAMSSLQGMKLIRLEEGGNDATAIVTVDFDRNAYLSDRNIRKRLRAEERRRKEQLEEEREEEEQRRREEREKEEKRRLEEEERAQKRARKLKEKQMKKAEQARIVAELKAVAASRREEAQQLLGVLLAGAAEARYAMADVHTR